MKNINFKLYKILKRYCFGLFIKPTTLVNIRMSEAVSLVSSIYVFPKAYVTKVEVV
jgi:regulator of PEP synthase PpsR (kinase-PPPase family)